MKAHVATREVAAVKRRSGTQYAALPYRVSGGVLEILLITSRRTRRWIVPKGWPVEGLEPAQCAAMWSAAMSGDLAIALPAYRRLHPLLRWDSKTEFVQAIKLSMDVVGRPGGACRPPRGRLAPEVHDRIVAQTEALVANGYK